MKNFAMVSADGTVRPIYNRQKTVSLSVNAYPGHDRRRLRGQPLDPERFRRRR
jgi:hypothetical protein